mgnify:CR=1 FL=1
MIRRDWSAGAKILRLFQSIGRASLLYDIQDSHSGNMAVKVRTSGGEDQIFITATGSQKGDLEPEQICCLSATETDYGYYKASSETDIHARILALPGAGASMHAHTKDLAIATLDDAPRPKTPADFVPVDPLGWHILDTNCRFRERSLLAAAAVLNIPATVHVAIGKYVGGVLEAETLLVKCPSKYEEQYGSNSSGGISK